MFSKERAHIDFIDNGVSSEQEKKEVERVLTHSSFSYLKKMENFCFSKEQENIRLKNEVKILEKENKVLLEMLDMIEGSVSKREKQDTRMMIDKLLEFKKQVFQWFSLDLDATSSEDAKRLRLRMKKMILDSIDGE